MNIREMREAQERETYSKFATLSENSKGRSLERLCEIIGIPIENSVAAGDYENDSDMILAAGIGAAVENAQESLKEKADIILPVCEEDAIAHLIEFLEEMYEW